MAVRVRCLALGEFLGHVHLRDNHVQLLSLSARPRHRDAGPLHLAHVVRVVRTLRGGVGGAVHAYYVRDRVQRLCVPCVCVYKMHVYKMHMLHILRGSRTGAKLNTYGYNTRTHTHTHMYCRPTQSKHIFPSGLSVIKSGIMYQIWFSI